MEIITKKNKVHLLSHRTACKRYKAGRGGYIYEFKEPVVEDVCKACLWEVRYEYNAIKEELWSSIQLNEMLNQCKEFVYFKEYVDRIYGFVNRYEEQVYLLVLHDMWRKHEKVQSN